jgi:hypothetical protein
VVTETAAAHAQTAVVTETVAAHAQTAVVTETVAAHAQTTVVAETAAARAQTIAMAQARDEVRVNVTALCRGQTHGAVMAAGGAAIATTVQAGSSGRHGLAATSTSRPTTPATVHAIDGA